MTQLEAAIAVVAIGAAIAALAGLVYVVWRFAVVRLVTPVTLPWQVCTWSGINTVYTIRNLDTGDFYPNEYGGRWMTQQVDRARNMADTLNKGM